MSSENEIQPVIGVIGGSGLYDIDGLENKQWRRVETPWGDASDELLFGTLDGVQCVFLPRHGRGHPIPPSRLNYRANIDALKRSGVTDILSLSAVGSLKEELPPGRFVLVDQFIDRSFAREKSFLIRAAWLMSVWQIPFQAGCWIFLAPKQRSWVFLSRVAERISLWKARSSRRVLKANFTVHGAVLSWV